MTEAEAVRIIVETFAVCGAIVVACLTAIGACDVWRAWRDR